MPDISKININSIEYEVKDERARGLIGDLTNLETENKSDLVSAINEAVKSGEIVETDPTVPAWAKEATKPTYTADEVGALPVDTVIPSALSDLTDDSTHRVVTDAEKELWNAKSDFSGSYNDLIDKPSIPSIEGLATEDYVDEKISIMSGGTGSGASATSAIIDVTSLPTENINEGAFYRLLSAHLVYNQYDQGDYGDRCYYVDSLPSVGEPVTTNTKRNTVYYSVADNDVYGYVTSAIGSQAGVSEGWYTVSVLAPLLNINWGGVITDIDDDPCDNLLRLLLSKDYYVYQNGWRKLPYAYESQPEFDIRWNGVIGDRLHIDVSEMFGQDAGSIYFVKVSDDVLSYEQLLGLKFLLPIWSENHIDIYEDVLDTETYPGCIVISVGWSSENNVAVIIYDVETFSSALGLPSGVLTNGTYFPYNGDNYYTTHLVSRNAKVKKIDGKYLDVNLDDVYTKSEVDQKIAAAIGAAIGGSY